MEEREGRKGGREGGEFLKNQRIFKPPKHSHKNISIHFQL
jgi:hypothetical protein